MGLNLRNSIEHAHQSQIGVNYSKPNRNNRISEITKSQIEFLKNRSLSFLYQQTSKFHQTPTRSEIIMKLHLKNSLQNFDVDSF